MTLRGCSEYNKGYNIKGMLSIAKYQGGTAGISACANTVPVQLCYPHDNIYNAITEGQVKRGLYSWDTAKR
jgi:hypothetical protein